MNKSGEFDKRIADNIREYGWHCLHIASTEEDETPFTYTIGLFETYSGPEIFIFNVEPKKAHAVLNVCAQVLREGGTIEPEVPDDRILAGGYKVIFRPLRHELFDEYAGTAVRHYGHSTFPAYVMFFPDAAGRFPWESGYDYIPADEAMSVV